MTYIANVNVDSQNVNVSSYSLKTLMLTLTLNPNPNPCPSLGSWGPLYVIVRSSVCLSSVVCRLSVTFVRPTQAIEIFGNISTPFGTLAIC